MSGHIPWPWTESLGRLRPDAEKRFRVKRILVGLVQDRCRELGLDEGLEIRCRDRNPEEVRVELPGNQMRDLELPYAWFVQVEPILDEVEPVLEDLR
jgi:hypothetical protein